MGLDFDRSTPKRTPGPMSLLLLWCAGAPTSACSAGSHDTTIVEGTMVPSFSVTPANMATGVDASTVIAVDFNGGTMLPAKDWLDASVRLRDMSGSSLVDASQSLAMTGDVRETYSLSPKAPLADGWYRVEIDAAPDVATPGQGDLYGLPGPDVVGPSKFESFFHVGSAPVLVAVSACASKDEHLYPKLLLSFSEPVDVSQPPPVKALVDGEIAACTLNGAPTSNPPMLELTCNPPIPATAKLAVTLTAGVVAAGSRLPVDLGGVDLGSRTIDVPQPEAGLPCRAWHESSRP